MAKSKNVDIPSVGKDVEEVKFLYTADGNSKLQPFWKTVWWVLSIKFSITFRNENTCIQRSAQMYPQKLYC